MPATETFVDDFPNRIAQIRIQIARLSEEHVPLRDAVKEAGALLDELASRRDDLLKLNHRLARVSAESTELLVELEEKNSEIEKVNRELSRANANAAELIGEIEEKNEHIDSLNRVLAIANASAAELVAELELRKEELEWVNRKLAETNDEKSHLIGVIAHDLRSGISGMGSLSVLLQDLIEPDSSSAVKTYVSLIHDESQRLTDLLASLLDMSRLDQGHLDLKIQKTDLNQILWESVDYHRPFADKKRQHLSVSQATGLPSVQADPARIRQVCDRLISNAIKFSPEQTTIELFTYLGDTVVSLQVKDEGPGLTNEDQERLFQSCQPLSARPTGGEESQGLGLSIARKVVELHKGTIWGRNRSSGIGACFGFSIPLNHSFSMASASTDNKNACRLLVFDSIVVNHHLVRRIASRLGHQVFASADPKEVTVWLEDHRAHLALIDCDLNVETGYELARSLSARKNRPAIPVIGLVSEHNEHQLSACLDAGMSDCLQKPLTREKLIHLIRRWVNT